MIPTIPDKINCNWSDFTKFSNVPRSPLISILNSVKFHRTCLPNVTLVSEEKICFQSYNVSYEITANLSRIFELYKNKVFCWKFSCFIFHSCSVSCLNVVSQFIKNTFFWNGDWKERILWQNMSFVRLQLAEWRSTFNVKVWVWKSRTSKIGIK